MTANKELAATIIALAIVGLIVVSAPIEILRAVGLLPREGFDDDG